MNFYKVIYGMILFMIIYVMVMVLSLLMIPMRGIWPNIPPVFVNKKAQTVILRVALIIFILILVFLIAMYQLWRFIKRFVPNFPIPFKRILLRMTPLKELEKSGLFGLMDAIAKLIPLIFQGKAKEGFRGIAEAMIAFLKKSSGMMLALVPPIQRPQVPGVTPAPRGAEPTTGGAPDDNTPEEEEAPYLTTEQNLMVQQQYEQCLEENTTPINPSMTFLERQQVTLSNSFAGTICDVQRFRTHADLLAAGTTS